MTLTTQQAHITLDALAHAIAELRNHTTWSDADLHILSEVDYTIFKLLHRIRRTTP